VITPITRPEQCPGCRDELVYPHCHATACPVFHEHVYEVQRADFIECGCGYLSVTHSDRYEHLKDVARKQRLAITETT
jgi:hypothetical protein